MLTDVLFSWQALTAISVLGLSVSIILQRLLLHRDKADPFAYAAVFQAIVGVILTVAAIIAGFRLPGIESLVLFVLISSIAYGVGHIMYAKTLQTIEASAFSVYFATHAVWMMVFGVLLFHESLTFLQIVGALLIFGGVLFLVKNPRELFKKRGAMYGLITGILFGIAITSWAYVGRYTDALSWAAVSFLLPALVVILIRPKTIGNIPKLLGKKSMILKLFVLAIFYAIGSLAMLYAYREGSIAIVSPLRQTGIIITTLLAFIFIAQERRHIWRKIFAAVICFVGVVAIVM
jgi:drug/metabolite transporter (DMT)-like permease